MPSQTHEMQKSSASGASCKAESGTSTTIVQNNSYKHESSTLISFNKANINNHLQLLTFINEIKLLIQLNYQRSKKNNGWDRARRDEM